MKNTKCRGRLGRFLIELNRRIRRWQQGNRRQFGAEKKHPRSIGAEVIELKLSAPSILDNSQRKSASSQVPATNADFLMFVPNLSLPEIKGPLSDREMDALVRAHFEATATRLSKSRPRRKNATPRPIPGPDFEQRYEAAS